MHITKAESCGGRIIEIDYTNWKGNRRKRQIFPIKIEWGKTKWHPEWQWILRAQDQEDLEVKGFSLKDIHSWCEIE